MKRQLFVLFTLLLTCVFSSQALSTPKSKEKIPVIIDNDMAFDDWLALAYLFKHSNVEVKAITVAGSGETTCPTGVYNTLNLLKLLNKEGIPVACGRSETYPGGSEFPQLWRDKVDDMLDLDLPTATEEPFAGDAVELLQKTLDENPGAIIISLGPLTNLADLLIKNPDAAKQIKMLYYMGGAVNVAGNVNEAEPSIPNTVAEWNIYVDPLAADVVIRSGVPFTLIPLDATNSAPLTHDFVNDLKANNTTAASQFVLDVIDAGKELIDNGIWYFWDPLAAAVAIHEELAVFEQMPIKITLGPDAMAGATKVAADGTKIRVAVKSFNKKFEKEFVTALSRTE